VFWLTFLVASLGYAWYSFYAPSNRIAWADGEVMNAVNAAFIPVTIDVDNSNAAEILSRYGVGPTPTTIITDSKGSVLQRKQGRISKADFLELLGKLDPSAVEYL
jgi:protein disulfide-isomerase